MAGIHTIVHEDIWNVMALFKGLIVQFIYYLN